MIYENSNYEKSRFWKYISKNTQIYRIIMVLIISFTHTDYFIYLFIFNSFFVKKRNKITKIAY